MILLVPLVWAFALLIPGGMLVLPGRLLGVIKGISDDYEEVEMSAGSAMFG